MRGSCECVILGKTRVPLATILTAALHALVWFTILSAIVQGELVPGRSDEPYVLDVGRKRTLSKQLLAYCSPNEKEQLRVGEGE